MQGKNRSTKMTTHTESALSDKIKSELLMLKNIKTGFFGIYKKEQGFFTDYLIEKIIQNKPATINFKSFSKELQIILQEQQTYMIHWAIYRAIFEIFQNQNPAMATEYKTNDKIKFTVKNNRKMAGITYGKPDKQTKDLEETIELQNLTKIENPLLKGKTVKVQAIVSSNTISYNVPNKVTAKCRITDEGHNCIKEYKFKINDIEKAKFVEIPDAKRHSALLQLSGFKFTTKCDIEMEEDETTTIKKFRIRPIMDITQNKDGKIIDEEGNEYKYYDIYLEQTDVKPLEAGKEIEITCNVIPDPKSQRITLIANKIEKVEDDDYNSENIKNLQLRYNELGSLQAIVNWITTEFEKYSKINKRNNITLAGLLTFFSPLTFEFESKIINGWMKTAIIGDSTTGKSETMKMLVKLLKNGQMITAETATIVGLTATATQASNNQWFVEWGALPLNDRKLLIVDGAHKLTGGDWASIAETERTGIINIVKAGKGQAKARTRQIKIMNPVSLDKRSSVPMKSLYYPVQAIVNTLQLQSIARQDIAVFVMDDVPAEDRNKRNNYSYDKNLDHTSDLLKLIWNEKFSIKLENTVIDEILLKATELENLFKTEDMPLITNDQKYKLARLSIGLAGLCCSFNKDFTELIILKEHVDFVSDFIKTEYINAGLDRIATSNRDLQVTREMIFDIVTDIQQILQNHTPTLSNNDILDMLVWMASQIKFTADVIKAKFQLSENTEKRPFIGYLRKEELISQKAGYIPTSKLINIGKFIDENKKSHTEIIKEKVVNVKRRIVKCNNCLNIEMVSDTPLEQLQAEHEVTHKGHVLVEEEIDYVNS